jgi:Mrp family chromosome partitioning ATPase
MSTIERALERAKQHLDGRERRSRTAPAATAPVDLRCPTFAQVAHDPAKCFSNRILVPESPEASRSPAAAGYRVLRTRLLQRARANNWTTIGITSPGQGEGKSVTALNLALTVAREGNNNVFLIDLDMRHPRLCPYIGVTPPKDINQYLAGDAAPEEVLFSIGIPHLTLAGTLTSTEDASELLASGRIEKLFEFIRTVAGQPLILIDLPPLLSTDDALIVAPKVDSCLLVVAEGQSRRDGASKALTLLAEFNLAGVVLNRSSAVVADYYSK